MAKTLIADLFKPDIWERAIIERTGELNPFVNSGVAATDPEFDSLAEGGGVQVNVPFFKDLIAARQLLSGAATLTVNKIATGKDIARIQNDAQAWSVNILAKVLSGTDPVGAIMTLVGGYWSRIDNSLIISTMKGVGAEFLNESGSFPPADPHSAFATGNLLAIQSESTGGQSSATRLNGTTFIDALLKLGDAANRITAVAMHSATEAALRKLDLIDFLPDSEGKPTITSFQGRRVIVDDAITSRAGTTSGTVYTTILFGEGAIAKGNGKLSSEPLEGGFGTEGVELARVPLDSDTVLINRRRFILHPRGMAFVGTPAGDSPTNTELETNTSWSRVYEYKNVRIVIVTHNN